MNEGCCGVEMPSLTKSDDETARPSVAWLSRLGSGIFLTSDILFACCFFRGSRLVGGPGPTDGPERLRTAGPASCQG